jgi:hypothetical protein
VVSIVRGRARRGLRPAGLSLVALFAAAIGACKSDKPGGAGAPSDAAAAPGIEGAVQVPGDAGTATPVPQPDGSDPRVYRSFHGQTFELATERHGDAMRAVYYSPSTPIHFRGKAEGGRGFSLRETGVQKGRSPMTLAGEWSPDGSTLEVTVKDPREDKTTRLSAKEGPFSNGANVRFKGDYKGTLGKHFVRMKLECGDGKLTGIYRYAKSAEDITLAGTVNGKQGTFELTESVHGKVTGTLAGAFAGVSSILATWSSPDSSRTFPVDLEQGDGYPETVAIGRGLSLFPQEMEVQGARCSIDSVYPQLGGAKTADQAKQKALNELLRGGRADVATCEEPDPSLPGEPSSSMEESYARLTEKNGRFLSLSQGGSWYTAGAAHPNGGSTCTVIDLDTLTQLRMVEALTKEGRDELGAKVTKALQGSGPKLDEQGYFSADLTIGPETNVCLTDTEIRVEFARYEVAAYFMGNPEAGFKKAEVRSLFKKDDVMDALFAQ